MKTWRVSLAFVLILGLAAYLRFENLATNPGWYTDEGTHLNIAQNLARGRVQYMAINQSTLLAARLPLFDLALAGLLKLWNGGMAALRGFTALLGVASAGLLFWVVRRVQQDGEILLPLLAALMLAIYPQAVLYSRFGFSYNLLVPLVLLAGLGMLEYLNTSRRRWLALAALAVGLGSITDLMMLVVLVPLAGVAGMRRWRDVAWSLALAALPFGVYVAVMLANAPQAFLFDASYILSRVSNPSLGEQLVSIASNYTILLAQDAWIALGMVGMFLLRPMRLRWLALLFFLWPILALGRTAALHSLSFYYMIPWLPFVALGIAALVRYGVPYAAHAIGQGAQAVFARWNRPADRLGRLAGFGAVAFVAAAPFIGSLAFTVERVQGHFGTVVDPFLVDPEDALSVAAYVNTHSRPEDIAIVSPAISWLFETRTADFQQAIAVAGQATPHLPADVPANRFAFDPRVEQARYVVVDNLWRSWGVLHIPALNDLTHELESWPLAFQASEIAVYRNPER